MKRLACISIWCLTGSLATAGQAVPEEVPLALDVIAARGGTPMPREDVLRLVTGATVEWTAFAGGGRRWVNEPGGEFWSNRFSTGVGSFNPHNRAGRGSWEVRADGSFCVHIDYRPMQVEQWCWSFFNADGHVLMHIEPPERPGDTVKIAQ